MFYNAAMAKREYLERPCKSALNAVRGMPFRWSLNPYRGCSHGCHYCYARATHPYLGMNADDDFSMRIIVKTNVVEVLRRDLRRPSWSRERVALGTATDAYQPCDGRWQLARGILRALRDFETPVSIVTKSTLVVRDLDILQELAGLPGTRVNFSLTTLNRTLWKSLEPGTPPPEQRLQAMARLADSGIPCGIYLAPILPGLTDDVATLAALATAAREHGATSFWGSALRLAPGVKDHFLGVLAEEWPEQLVPYQREYQRADASPAYVAQIERRLAMARQSAGFPTTSDAIMRPDRPHESSRVERQLVLGL